MTEIETPSNMAVCCWCGSEHEIGFDQEAKKLRVFCISTAPFWLCSAKCIEEIQEMLAFGLKYKVGMRFLFKWEYKRVIKLKIRKKERLKD